MSIRMLGPDGWEGEALRRRPRSVGAFVIGMAIGLLLLFVVYIVGALVASGGI